MPKASKPESDRMVLVRLMAGAALLVIVALGLGSRSDLFRSIPVLGHTFGDAAWAAAAYTSLRILFPAAAVRSVAIGAIVTAFLVECSQLWHPAWLDELRSNGLVALLIGRGFLWEDLLAYVVGVAVIATLDRFFRKWIFA